MAKLKAPLFSFGASGKIADALVYFSWKGLDVVRQYVVPSNPKTADQVTQRGYLTAAVKKIHDTQAQAAHALDEDDTSAYALLGGTHKTPRTWFNEIVKLWIDCEILSDKPVVYSDGTISSKTAASLTLIFYLNEKTAEDLVAAEFYFGTSKTALIHKKTATIVSGVSAGLTTEDCSAFLTAGTKYFVQCRPIADDPAEHANSGIYTFVAE